jgi:hypothetical protein
VRNRTGVAALLGLAVGASLLTACNPLAPTATTSVATKPVASVVAVPAAPSGLVAVDNHDGTATLKWKYQAGVSSYHIRYVPAATSTKLAGTVATYRTPKAAFGTVVRFQLAAGNSAGFSATATAPAITLAKAPAVVANKLIVGSFTNTTAGATTQSFVNERTNIPGLQVRRAFNSGMPTSIANTEAAKDAAAGVVTFLSVKPSYTAVGSDNAKIASLAKSMPAGSYLTAWHEPENDMTAAQYVAMFRNFYSVAKAANPNIYVGNVYMTYQWGAGRKVTTPDAWWAGANSTDFLGTDTYMDTWQKDAAGNPKPLSADPDHMRWHNWAAGKGKPLLLTESGVGQGFTDAQRANYYLTNEAWLTAHNYRMFLPWNGAGTPPTGESWDFFGGSKSWPQTMAAMKAIATRGQASAKL